MTTTVAHPVDLLGMIGAGIGVGNIWASIIATVRLSLPRAVPTGSPAAHREFCICGPTFTTRTACSLCVCSSV